MDDEAQKISEMMRKGTYFDEARAWYQAVYIGPISERSFFLLIAALSVVVAIASLIAVNSMLPLVSRPGLLIRSGPRIDDIIPRLEVLKEPEKSLTSSLLRFFIVHYVAAREGYSVSTYGSGAAFVRAQSNDAVYGAFSKAFTATNPTSPAATLGATGARNITVTAIQINTNTSPMSAEVDFTAETTGSSAPVKTRWTARMQYTYTDLAVVDPQGESSDEVEFQDPHFQVISYESNELK
ncbi:MAG: VirB8/TrbF family protein [Pseudomonadota bacterium]